VEQVVDYHHSETLLLTVVKAALVVLALALAQE
jgi:hypothetical protein